MIRWLSLVVPPFREWFDAWSLSLRPVSVKDFLNDFPSAFKHWLILQNPFWRENGQIKNRFPPQHQLGNITSHRVALLKSVSRKPVRKEKPSQLWPLSKNGIAIQGIHFI